MTILDRATIKANFQTGDKPTQTQFEDWIDASVGKLPATTTYNASVTTDLTTGYVFRITLTGDLALQNPTGGIDCNTYTWHLKQDGTGGHSITLAGSKFKLPSSAGPLAFSVAPNALDILVVQYDSAADLFYIVSMIPGY